MVLSSVKSNISWCLITCVILAFCCICESSLQSTLEAVAEATLNEDGKLNFTELATKFGLKPKQYEVVTEDGYILTMFRVPGKKPPVLLFHGMCDTAEEFILRGNISLVVTLANAGYDVWIGNNRGNKYARRHIRLNPDTDAEFWDYSFHEIGYYDIAASIDFIRNKTGEAKISIIGHSQGTTAFYALAATRPEYNEKIKVSISLAPGVFYNNNESPIVSLMISAGPVIDALVPLNVQELLRYQEIGSNLMKFICSKGMVSYVLCGLGGLLPIVGWNPASFDSKFFNTLIGHFPTGCSRKCFLHYDQIFLRKKYSQYDYGNVKNLEKYGKEEPPDYDLKAITMRTALLVGKNDNFSTVKDVDDLRKILPNVVYYKLLKPKLWNHVDFVYNINMPRYLYPSVFEVLAKYN